MGLVGCSRLQRTELQCNYCINIHLQDENLVKRFAEQDLLDLQLPILKSRTSELEVPA